MNSFRDALTHEMDMEVGSILISKKIILIFICLFIGWTYGATLKYTIPKVEGCALVGFPNATINECGYCVKGGTNLDEDYGKDCNGVCFGDAQYDCAGHCNGHAYMDECSGICIDTSPLTLSATKTEVTGLNMSISRDCRGMCIPPELSRPQQQAYDRDECGICRLQSSESSMFLDCNGICQLPGLEKASLICDQCVDKNTTTLWQVLDECGNCRSERKYCSCDKDPSICGCNDPNSCYHIRSLIPSAVPSNVTSKILLSGYFHPVMKDLHCLLRHESSRQIISFPVSFILKNKTVIECVVNTDQDGTYNLVLGSNNSQRVIFPKNSIELVVYNREEVSLTNMKPAETSTKDSDSPLKIQFADLRKTLPLLPFRCKVTYMDRHEEISMPGNEPLTCIIPASTRRAKSQLLLITPTFDGIHPLSQSFTLTVKAPLPSISHQNCYVSEDGLAVIIIFERPIEHRIPQSSNASSLCEHLLTPLTLKYLNTYDIHNCLLVTKTQLIIYVETPITENTVTIKFNKGSISESEQLVAEYNEKELEVAVKKLSSEPSWWSFEPVIAITGPSEIPQCGSFALIGHFSSPRGTHNVQFQWDVARDGGEVSVELKQYIENNGKSTNLLLISLMFETHVPYKFFFKAYLPDTDQTLVVGHTLLRLNYDSPLVSIYHTTLLQTKPLSEDENVTLVAEVSVPECVHPVQRVIIFWKVSDPRILFPLKEEHKRSSIIYEIKPYSVPVDVPVGFYLNSFFGYKYNVTSGAGFSLIVRKAPLKAVIANGSPKITIGSKSGMFKLISQGSSNGRSKKLTYQWSCHESKTAQPCYFNFASLKTLSDKYKKRDALLITKSMQQQATLNLDSSMFYPNKQYWFGLQVFDINNASRASETEYVLVKVTEGNGPQVFIGPVYVKGKHLVSYNARLSSVVVPAFTQVTIKGNVSPASNIALLKWEVSNSIFPLNWNHKIVNDEIHTELKLHKDHILPFGAYVVKLIACNTDGICSEVDISLMAPQGVSNCQVVVEPFVEYEQTAAFVQSCNTPPGYAPLTYQIYYADESLEHAIPVTIPQFSSVLTFPGTPLAATANNQITRFAAQVCDRYEHCQMFYSSPVNIERSENDTVSIDGLLKVAKRYHTAGDSMAAMSIFASPLTHPEESNSWLYEKVVNDTLNYAVEALKNPAQTLTEGHVSLAYFVLSSAVKKTDNPILKSKLLATIERFTEKSKGLQKLPQMRTIKMLYSTLVSTFRRSKKEKEMEIYKPPELLLDVRNTLKEMREVAASQVQLGSVERLGRESDEDDGRVYDAITLLVHDFKVYDINIAARMSEDQVVEAKISFGEEVKRQFNPPWDCGQEQLCQSVVFAVTIYPSENPYPMPEYSFKISPIIEMTIHAPNTGKEQHVKGLLKAASFFVTITGNETAGAPDYTTKCLFYDEAAQIWKTDGIHSLGIEYRTTGCWSGHLTSFVVLRINEGLNADYVIGVLVAVTMGILVLGMMVVFYVQKKREHGEQTSKVSPAPKVDTPVKKPVQYVRKPNVNANNQNINTSQDELRRKEIDKYRR